MPDASERNCNKRGNCKTTKYKNAAALDKGQRRRKTQNCLSTGNAQLFRQRSERNRIETVPER